MKTLFVWEAVSGLTNSYHDGGGLLVIADNLEFALALVVKTVPNPKECDALNQPPDFTAPVVSDVDKVMVFPDAGCC